MSKKQKKMCTISRPSLSPARHSEPKLPSPHLQIGSPMSSKRKSNRGNESEDEERWLDALESGKLEEVDDELKKMKVKDPKLMTARQRAMMERRGHGPTEGAIQLLCLPSGYRESVLTPEMVKKNAQKRKQLVEEKREKDQKRTVERLLGKQDPKTKKSVLKKTSRKSGAMVILTKNTSGVTISLPVGMDFPLKPQSSAKAPSRVFCGVEGCYNLKKYQCSVTAVPLCGLSCYRKNLYANGLLT